MRYFYILLFIVSFSIMGKAQITKPLNPPSKSNTAQKQTPKPIKAAINGIPSARTTVINSFKPSTQPALKRRPASERLKVVEHSKEGSPIMIKGSLGNAGAGRDINTQVYDYLEAIKNPILIKNPKEEFTILERKTDAFGQTHFKMQQQFKGVKVYGGQVWLHAEKGQINLFNGRNIPTPNIENLSPSLSKSDAQDIANQDVSLKTKIKEFSKMEKQLIGEQKIPELIIYSKDDFKEVKLAWHLKFHANLSNEWEYFIDAHSGEILDAYKTLCQLHYHPNLTDKKIATISSDKKAEKIVENKAKKEASYFPQNGPTSAVGTDLNNFNRTVNAYEINGDYFLIDASRPMYNAARSSLPDEPVGAIWTINAQNTYPENDDFEVIHVANGTNNWDDPISVSAHYNAGVAYEYFRTAHNRNSINDGGGTIVSIINVSDEDGSGLDNAFWSGSAMFYGNGGQAFQPLAKSLDVAGHEIAHGVIQNTANLRYQGESGAMNESFADVFGVLIDRDDYFLGEDVVNPNIFRSGALRSMGDPHNGGNRLGDNGWQPSHVNEQFLGREDNGGVHINSGITNRAFFLVANNIGKDKAEQIYYRALSTYLVNTSQFVDLRASLLQSATDIHGGNSIEVSIVAQAFDAVGILGSNVGSGADSGGEDEIEVEFNPGSDFIIFTDDARSNLSLADGAGNILLSPFTETGILSRPSVTDDGTAIVFVADDKTIHLITIETNGDVFEEVIQEEPIWRNVAVSRDGYRVAALRDDNSNTIEIFDFTIGEWEIFELYNPTFTEGISTGEVQYADVIEFDFSGEYLMYDASNAIKGNFGGEDIEYWDIGFIKVYDNTIDNYEQDIENNIFKLFSGLPENISIGNPTFSKNSPNIIAFDYIDDFEETYELRGLNLSNNDEKTIFTNGGLSVPNYSRLDDKIIFNAATTEGENVVAVIPIGDDKISAAGEAQVLIFDTPGAQLGVWFSDGTRQLTATNELEKSVFDLQIAPNPFTDNLTLQFSLEERKDLTIELYNTLGQRQLSQAIESLIGHNIQQINTTNLPSGTYFVSLKSSEGIVTRKVVK